MADISGFIQDQTALRAELDQLKQEAWLLLASQGMDWYQDFDEIIQGLIDRDDDLRVVGILAEIGVLHMCESYIPGGGE